MKIFSKPLNNKIFAKFYRGFKLYSKNSPSQFSFTVPTFGHDAEPLDNKIFAKFIQKIFLIIKLNSNMAILPLSIFSHDTERLNKIFAKFLLSCKLYSKSFPSSFSLPPNYIHPWCSAILQQNICKIFKIALFIPNMILFYFPFPSSISGHDA